MSLQNTGSSSYGIASEKFNKASNPLEFYSGQSRGHMAEGLTALSGGVQDSFVKTNDKIDKVLDKLDGMQQDIVDLKSRDKKSC